MNPETIKVLEEAARRDLTKDNMGISVRLASAIREALAELKEKGSLPVADGWISVKELPTAPGFVMIASCDKAVFVAMYHECRFKLECGDLTDDVTHWRPLPPPPKDS